MTADPQIARLAEIATAKGIEETEWQIFLRALGCNWLVCLAVWMALGAEDIAGGIFGPDSVSRARAMGRDPKAMLDDNDGHSFFEMLGDSIVTGPTKTNVNDFRATLIAP